MLTQSIRITSFEGRPAPTIAWDGEPSVVAEAKRAWLRLLLAYHDKKADRLASCTAAVQRHFTSHGLVQGDVDAAVVAAQEMVELIERLP